MPHDLGEHRGALAHVLWIGGPPDSGKTSIAALLAQRHGLQVYHFDRHEPAHFARVDPARHPAVYAAHPDRMSPEERWLGSSPEEMARATIASWTERCGMALDDLRAMLAAPPIVAEGPGFFPERIAPLLPDHRLGAWLIPSEDFKRASVTRRAKLANIPTSDPARARENLIRRDLLMGEHIRRQAEALGLAIYDVDGARSLDEIAALVEAQFSPWLPRRS